LFYCHYCAGRYGWPADGVARSFGRCEKCERQSQSCLDVPSFALPLPTIDTPLEWVYDDGGREAAGYRGSAGDCVVRAFAIVTRQHYSTAYDLMAEKQAGQRAKRGSKPLPRSARDGVLPKVYKPIFADHGMIWTPLAGIGTGIKVHLRRGEVPRSGRHILRLSGHLCALVEGVVRDTGIDDREGTRAVYGYWTFKDS
jgi:hypothetical protein